MTQLTEERFQEILKQELAPLATKQDVRDAVEELAGMTKRGFDDVLEQLDVRERMATVEQKLQKIEQALHITL